MTCELEWERTLLALWKGLHTFERSDGCNVFLPPYSSWLKAGHSISYMPSISLCIIYSSISNFTFFFDSLQDNYSSYVFAVKLLSFLFGIQIDIWSIKKLIIRVFFFEKKLIFLTFSFLKVPFLKFPNDHFLFFTIHQIPLSFLSKYPIQ